jgi:hypothetical protein
MEHLAQALAEFTARRHSSAASKMDALLRIEGFSDPRVLPFLLQVVVDVQELPEVRAHVIKALRIRHLARDERAVVGAAIGRILGDRPSAGLRVQAALTLAEFTDVEGVTRILGTVALDETEPLDLRYSAFTSLERAMPRSDCIDVLRRLTVDDTFDRLARRVLSTWSFR